MPPIRRRSVDEPLARLQPGLHLPSLAALSLPGAFAALCLSLPGLPQPLALPRPVRALPPAAAMSNQRGPHPVSTRVVRPEPAPAWRECSTCGGSGTGVEITAEPLPSGEPGEP